MAGQFTRKRSDRMSMGTAGVTSWSRTAVEAISQLKREPAWMTERRLAAWDAYERAPLKDDQLRFSLNVIQPFVEKPHAPVPSHQWPKELQNALDERGDEEGLIV